MYYHPMQIRWKKNMSNNSHLYVLAFEHLLPGRSYRHSWSHCGIDDSFKVSHQRPLARAWEKNHFKFLVQKKEFIIKAWIIYFYDSNSGEWLRMWKVGRHFFIFTFFYYLFLLWKKVRDVLKGKEKKSVKKPSLLFLIKKKKR